MVLKIYPGTLVGNGAHLQNAGARGRAFWRRGQAAGMGLTRRVGMQPRGDQLSYKRFSNHSGADLSCRYCSVIVAAVPFAGALTGGCVLETPSAPFSILGKETARQRSRPSVSASALDSKPRRREKSSRLNSPRTSPAQHLGGEPT